MILFSHAGNVVQSSLVGTLASARKVAAYSPAAAGTSLGMVILGNVCWIHWFPNTVALMVPLYGRTG